MSKKRMGVGSITITDVKGWDGTPPTYATLQGSISDVPQINELTSGKIKKEDTYTKEEINNIMDNMVRFDNQTYLLIKPNSADNKISLKMNSDGIDEINTVIKWSKEDYEYETWSLGDQELITTREYPSDDPQIIRITGNIGFDLVSGTIEDVIQWGGKMTKFVYLKNFLKNFQGESITAQDMLNTSYGISLESFLEGATNFNQYLNRWFPRYPGSMKRCFYGCSSFNQKINNLNVEFVTSFKNAFNGCSSFNQKVYRWRVENAFDMEGMFQGCSSFDQDLSDWNTESCTNMNNMFNDVALANRDLSSWNVANVITNTDFLVSTGSGNTLPLFSQDI